MLSFSLVVVGLISQIVCDDVNVTTPLGIIRGTQQRTDPDGNFYYSFKGIRYGLANRFEQANPVKPWKETYDAREDKPTCVQIYFKMDPFIPPIPIPESEDCLYLTVSTPKLPKDKNFSSLPVIFWIHGGFFAFGDSRYDSYGPDFFMDAANVVLVSINYRLGVFGFLGTGDARLSGNQGIKDSILALQWVKTNIAAFGGDPNKVTIMGETGGAAMVSYLTQSPLTKGKNLFHRAIVQSGSSLSAWSVQKNPSSIFWKTAIAAGCVRFPYYFYFSDVMACLKLVSRDVLKSASQFVSEYNNLIMEVYNGFSYAPSIEPESPYAAVTQNTHQLLRSKNAPTIPILTGIATEEMAILKILPKFLPPFFAEVDSDNRKLVQNNMYATTIAKVLFIAPAIRKYYFNGTTTSASSISNKIRFLSDVIIDRAWREYINLLRSKTNVHCYILSYDGPMGGFDISYPGIGSVAHTEDVAYLFRNQISKGSNFPPQDFANRKRMIRLWTNYATYGNPTPNINDSVLGNIQWPALNPTGNITKCLDIGEKLSLIDNPEEEEYQFWRNLYNSYGYVLDTY